jgi:hypothetical protein
MTGELKHKAHMSEAERESGEYCTEQALVAEPTRNVGQGQYGPLYENTYLCQKHGFRWDERIPE